jgi:hypothetical protein
MDDFVAVRSQDIARVPCYGYSNITATLMISRLRAYSQPSVEKWQTNWCKTAKCVWLNPTTEAPPQHYVRVMTRIPIGHYSRHVFKKALIADLIAHKVKTEKEQPKMNRVSLKGPRHVVTFHVIFNPSRSDI